MIRGGYGIFYEVESSGNRVNHNMVPYTLSETVFNDGLRTMATFLRGPPDRRRHHRPQPHWRLSEHAHGLRPALEFRPATPIAGQFRAGSELRRKPGCEPVRGQPDQRSARRARAPFKPGSPYPIFGAITYNGQDNSTIYHALQAKFEKRVSGGLWYLVSYTWSKSINVGNTPSVGGDYAYERAISSFDIPQNLTASAGYELPVGKGKKLLANPQPCC